MEAKGVRMKSQAVFLFCFALLGLLSCQKSNQSADVPGMQANCVNNPSLCQPYTYQQSPGFSNYNGYNSYNNYYGGGAVYGGYNNGSYNPFYYTNNAAYLCNCPSGYIPTYNSYAGLGCVQNTSVYGFGYLYFSWGVSTNQWTSVGQITSISAAGYSSSSSACYNGVVQSCLTTQINSCMIGYSCRSSSAGSQLGLCISDNLPRSTYGGSSR